jgi:hypothetical protein
MKTRRLSEAALVRAQAVRVSYVDELMQKANVVGVGVGLFRKGGRPTLETGLVVLVTHKVPQAQLAPADLVPAEIEGVPVDVQEVGEIRAHR